MDHQEAIGLSAAERYLLGELSPLERDDFEEHYFNCHECATEVRLTSHFLDGARKELVHSQTARHVRPAPKGSFIGDWLALLWKPAFLGPVAALLLLFVGYQNVVVYPHLARTVAQLRQPAVLTAVSLISASVRGAGGRLQVSGNPNQPVLLAVDIPGEERFGSYVCELVTTSGTVLWSVPVSGVQAHDTVSISVPAGTLQAGAYALVVKGLMFKGPAKPDSGSTVSPASGGEHGVDLARYAFDLRFPSAN